MSCEPESTKLTIVSGDTAKLKFTVTAADCETLVDFDDYDEIVFTLKRSNQDSDAAAVWQGTLALGDIEVINPSTDGVCEVTVPPIPTLRMGRNYFWDLQLKDEDGNLYTPLFGTLLATAQSTKKE